MSNDESKDLSKDDAWVLSLEVSTSTSRLALSEPSKLSLRVRVNGPNDELEVASALAEASSEALSEALEVELELELCEPLAFQLFEPLAAMLFEPLALLLLEPLAFMLLEPLALLLLEPLALLLFEPLALLLCEPATLKLELELLSMLASNEPLREDEPLLEVVKVSVSTR